MARKGAMRRLPLGEHGWVEVDSADEMVEVIRELATDEKKRHRLTDKTVSYYWRYFEAEKVTNDLKKAYLEITDWCSVHGSYRILLANGDREIP